MSELLKIEVNSNQEQTVSGRELHMFLGIETPYMKWFERMLQYGFDENKDFWTKMSESTGGRPSTDHIMKLDMAKELCMLARNEKGKQARQYFLEVEREWNSPEKVMARALVIANTKLAEVKAELIQAKPKVDFVDTYVDKGLNISLTELGKKLGKRPRKFIELLQDEGYLMRHRNNMPYQSYINRGLFEIKTVTERGLSQTVVTPKGVTYFAEKYGDAIV